MAVAAAAVATEALVHAARAARMAVMRLELRTHQTLLLEAEAVPRSGVGDAAVVLYVSLPQYTHLPLTEQFPRREVMETHVAAVVAQAGP